MLKQRLKKEKISIYKLASLTAKPQSPKHLAQIQWLRRIFKGRLIDTKEKNRLKAYFRKVKLEHLIDDDDFKVICLERFKLL